MVRRKLNFYIGYDAESDETLPTPGLSLALFERASY